MFERFTNRARHAVVLAQEEARRLQHNYIGTEHVLLGLLGEPEGYAARALAGFGITLDGAREEVKGIVGAGNQPMSGHIPFTPRAKKTLELALREALQLSPQLHRHRAHPARRDQGGRGRRRAGPASSMPTSWRSARPCSTCCPRARARRPGAGAGRCGAAVGGDPLEPGGPAEQTELRTTPAADTSLSEAARLAGGAAGRLAPPAARRPGRSRHRRGPGPRRPRRRPGPGQGGAAQRRRHRHQRRAARGGRPAPDGDPRGRRQAHDRGRRPGDRGRPAAPRSNALGDEASAPGTIRGDLPVSASLSTVWQALHDSLGVIERRATLPAESAPPDRPADPGTDSRVTRPPDDPPVGWLGPVSRLAGPGQPGGVTFWLIRKKLPGS